MGKYAGIGILAAVVIGVGVYFAINKKTGSAESESVTEVAPAEPVTVSALVGGEKMAFLQNPRVREVFARFGVTLQAVKVGSQAMVANANPTVDCLWPSTQLAVEQFRAHQGSALSHETIFNSALVLYSWASVTDVLVKQGVVQVKEGIYYIDMRKLVDVMMAGKTWTDMGLDMPGKVKVKSTNPRLSNTGNMFAALFLTTLAGGDTPTAAQVSQFGPQIGTYFASMGFMSDSSSDIFAEFLVKGVGAYPIMAGYESQLIEFALANPQHQQLIKSRVRTLYPRPTVWGEHPLIAITSKCKRLGEALKDPEIQTIAWESHGFRSGMAGVQNDPKGLIVGGIPQELTSIVSMPSAAIMDQFMTHLGAAR